MGRLVLKRLVINEWDLLRARKGDNSPVIEKGFNSFISPVDLVF